MGPLTDSHAHLATAGSRDVDLPRALSAFAESGGLLVDVGTEAEDLGPRLACIREAWGATGREGAFPPFIRVSAGLYPSKENLSDPEAALDRLEASIRRFYPEAASIDLRDARPAVARPPGEGSLPRLAAIGECGIDFLRMVAPAEIQRLLFGLQLRLAGRLRLPVIVHSRQAHAETLAALRERPPAATPVLHCFGYGAAEAGQYLDEGAYVSFSGNISYSGSEALREAAAIIPAERLLCETDAPYLNPEPRRGLPSSPVDVERTMAVLAQLRGVGIEELSETIRANAAAVFGA